MKKKLPKIFFTKFCLISNIFTKYFLIKIFLEKYTVLYQQFDKITFFLSAGIHGTCHFFSSWHKPNISPTFISLFLLFSNCRASFARQNFAIPNSFFRLFPISGGYSIYFYFNWVQRGIKHIHSSFLEVCIFWDIPVSKGASN